MFNAIAAVFKYSVLVLTILVLSHIIQIKGVTISRHVENSLNWMTGGRTHAQISKISQQFSSAVHHEPKENADGISKEDQKKLDSIIFRSSLKK